MRRLCGGNVRHDEAKDELLMNQWMIANKPNMTPLIDIVFLLLVFFILTTKFIPEEKVIKQLLPTDQGSRSVQQEMIDEPEDIF